MTDPERVISGIQEMLMRDTWRDIDPDRKKYQGILKGAVYLIKNQVIGVEPHKATEEQIAFAEKVGIAVPALWCGACGFMMLGGYKYCPNCGKKVKRDG